MPITKVFRDRYYRKPQRATGSTSAADLDGFLSDPAFNPTTRILSFNQEGEPGIEITIPAGSDASIPTRLEYVNADDITHTVEGGEDYYTIAQSSALSPEGTGNTEGDSYIFFAPAGNTTTTINIRVTRSTGTAEHELRRGVGAAFTAANQIRNGQLLFINYDEGEEEWYSQFEEQLTAADISGLLNGSGLLEESALDENTRNLLSALSHGHVLRTNTISSNVVTFGPGDTGNINVGTDPNDNDWDFVVVSLSASEADIGRLSLDTLPPIYLMPGQIADFYAEYLDNSGSRQRVRGELRYQDDNDRIRYSLGTIPADADEDAQVEILRVHGLYVSDAVSGGLDEAQVDARVELTQDVRFLSPGEVSQFNSLISILPMPSPASLTVGDSFLFFVETNITGPITLTFSGTSYTVVRSDLTAFEAGDLGPGDPLIITYNGTLFVSSFSPAVKYVDQTLTPAQRNIARLNISAAELEGTSANLVTPTNQGYEIIQTITQSFSSITFTEDTAGNAVNAADGPLLLQFAPDLTATPENSFLNLEITFTGNGVGTGTLYLGRVDGANVFRALDEVSESDFLNIDPTESVTLSARLHTDQAEEQADGSFIWKVIVGSNSDASLSTGDFTFSGTITTATGESLMPNSWINVFSEGDGYLIPYRATSSTWFTELEVVALDHPLNLNSFTWVWLDIDPHHIGNYGAVFSRRPIVIPMNSVWDNRTFISSPFTNVEFDATRVMCIDTRSSSYAGWGFGAGNTRMGSALGIQWIAGDPENTENITHFSVVLSTTLSGFSRGRIKGIYGA